MTEIIKEYGIFGILGLLFIKEFFAFLKWIMNNNFKKSNVVTKGGNDTALKNIEVMIELREHIEQLDKDLKKHDQKLIIQNQYLELLTNNIITLNANIEHLRIS
jgi:hypothetical protein